MLAEQIDFYKLYKIRPTAMVLLTGDLTVIDFNDEFEAYLGRPLEEVAGRNIFDLTPKPTQDPRGQPVWTPLEEALTSGQREVTKLMRYDLEDPHQPGVFEPHYWAVVAQPIPGFAGESELIELSARDATPIISQFQALQAKEEQSAG